MMTLRSRLRRIRWRLWIIGLGAGVLWSLFGAALLSLGAAWLDLVWEMSAEARQASLAAAALALLGGIAAAGAMLLRAAGDGSLARRVDRSGELGGRVTAGLDLERRVARVEGRSEPLSDGLARIAVAQAADAAASVPAARAVPARPLQRAGEIRHPDERYCHWSDAACRHRHPGGGRRFGGGREDRGL